jgi:hypothetical protein
MFNLIILLEKLTVTQLVKVLLVYDLMRPETSKPYSQLPLLHIPGHQDRVNVVLSHFYNVYSNIVVKSMTTFHTSAIRFKVPD